MSRKPSELRCGEAMDAELATARHPGSLDPIPAVLRAYESLGLEQESMHVIARLSRNKIDTKEILPYLIKILVKRRDLAKLNQLIRTRVSSAAHTSGPATLRLALAQALALLNQLKPAALVWSSLIEGEGGDRMDWAELARFVAANGDIQNLGSVLERWYSGQASNPVDELALFCLLRTRMDRSPDSAAEILGKIPPCSIVDEDLVFDLALSAFRLANYAYAESVIEHGLSLKPGWRCLENLLCSCRAFAGHATTFNGSFAIRTSVIDAITATAARVPSKVWSWGYIQEGASGMPKLATLPFEDPDERALTSPPHVDIVSTYSILPETPFSDPDGAGSLSGDVFPDPMEVLPYVDWELQVPHLMYQRRNQGECIHAFVDSEDVFHEWTWCEVSLVHDKGGEMQSSDTMTRESSLWGDVVHELREVTGEEVTS